MRGFWIVVVAWLASAAAAVAAPYHYDLRADLSPAAGTLSVDLTVNIPAAETTREIVFVLGRAYRIASADAGPHARVAVAETDKPWAGLQSITVTPSRPGARPLKLRLRYGGLLGPSGKPPLNAVSPQLTELNLDSMWAPVRSDLGGRFTLDADIRGVPRHLEVVAPGRVRRRGDRLIIQRAQPDLDVAFVAAPGLQRVSTPGFEFYAADVEGERARQYRLHGARALAFFEDWFGTMPGRPARVVMVRRERESGYARRGYVVVTDSDRGGERGLAKFIAHELAHAWWSSGDATGEDRWLSEGVAEYAAVRYVELAFGEAAKAELIAERREKAKGARSILGGGLRGNPELYNKAPVLLFELEQRIGRERMDSLLAQLAREPPENTAEFLKALAGVAGAPAAAEFEAALRA